MKKLIFLLAIFSLFTTVSAQKFVWGDLKVSGDAHIKGSVYSNAALTATYLSIDSILVSGETGTTYLSADSSLVSYSKSDSLLLGSQKIVYATGDSIPDLNYVNTNYSGALTDGAPTAAELNGIAGTAANAGAGFKAVIKDTDGTALYYLIISDGTNWHYYTGTLAL